MTVWSVWTVHVALVSCCYPGWQATKADLQEQKEEVDELRERMKQSRESSAIASTLGNDLQMMKQLQASVLRTCLQLYCSYLVVRAAVLVHSYVLVLHVLVGASVGSGLPIC